MSLPERIKDILRSALRRWEEHRFRRLKSRAAQVLGSPIPPICLDSEEVFSVLQSRFAPLPDYGYDALNCWKRGVERVQGILEELPSFREPGKGVFEAGCGDGMTGAAFAGYGHSVVLADAEDWRESRARDLEFRQCDLCQSIPLPDGSFDLVYSFNTFEHLSHPDRTLKELVRLCVPGGCVYLDFGPLYWAPFGLHAHRTFNMPYPQMLFTKEFIDRKLRDLGIRDLGKNRSALQAVNGWRLERYERLWRECGCEIVQMGRRTVHRYLEIILEYPQAFHGRGLNVDDLTVYALHVVLRKP